MDAALGFISLGIGFVITVFVAMRYRLFAAALLVAFALRAGLAFIDAYVYVLPGHADSLRYDHFAFYWARNGVLGTFEYITTGANLYTWLLSFFYAVFDRSTLMMQGVNVLFGALIVVNVGQLTLLLGGKEKHARQAAWLCAVFPGLVLYSAVLLREVAVAYPLSLGAVYLTRWYQERRAKDMLFAVAAFLASMAFHSGSVAVLLAAGVWLLGSWVRSLFSQGFRNLGRNSIALVAGALAIAFVFSSGFGMQKFKNVESGEIDRLSESQTYFAKGRAAYLQDLHPESRTDVVIQAPLRLVYFLFAPFPWMLSTGSDVIGVMDSAFFFFLFFRIWRRRKEFMARPDRVLLLAVFAAMALTFAIGVSNYGTALRHRNKMLPLLVAVAFSVAWGPEGRRRQLAPGPRPVPRSA